MTGACIAVNRGILPDYGHCGLSDDARLVSRLLQDAFVDFLRTITAGRLYEEVMKAIDEAARESAVDNWDGYGAKALNHVSRETASLLARALPTTLPVPDVSVDPDGMVEMEWYRSPRRVFSVTVESDGTLIYAGLFGSNKAYGRERFLDDVPEPILDGIQRVYSNG